MANDLVRKVNLLGNYKTILGDDKSDIVLETLGKVYIKTGNNLKLLNELFKQLDRINQKPVEEIKKSVIITQSIESLDYPGEGILVFDISKKALYISYDNRYVLILDNVDIDESTNAANSLYVKKTGDTMTGPLTITHKGAPLIIASKALVKKLNVEYINSYSSNEIAIKKRNEYIEGHWTFAKDIEALSNINVENDLTVNHNGYFNKDVNVARVLTSENKIVVKNKIGSEDFFPGYVGYGWELNSNTNMLTIDYLVVRKAMQVYELTVNEISATNGSLWVTDACKVKSVKPIYLLDPNNLEENNIENSSDPKWYLPLVPNNISQVTVTKDHIANSNGKGTDTIFYNYGYIVQFKQQPSYITKDLFNQPNEQLYTIEPLFKDHQREGVLFTKNAQDNLIYSTDINDNPPVFYSTQNKPKFSSKDEIQTIFIYYKYFAKKSKDVNNYFLITLDDQKYPNLKEGDLIRCQKFSGKDIKYYDALVVSRIEQSFLILLADSVFDLVSNQDGTEVIDTKHYKTSELSSILTTVESEDNLVRIGSICDPLRQSSIFMSSSELYSPHLTVIDKINKPDFTVNYRYPKFKKILRNGEYYYCKPVLLQLQGNEYYTDPDTLQIYLLVKEPDLKCSIETNSKNEFLSESANHVKVRLGNLNGVDDSLLIDNPAKGYGLYGQNVYLTGEFYLNNGKSVVQYADDQLNLALGKVDDVIQDIKNTVTITTLDKLEEVNADNLCNTFIQRIETIYSNIIEPKHTGYNNFITFKGQKTNEEQNVASAVLQKLNYNFYLVGFEDFTTVSSEKTDIHNNFLTEDGSWDLPSNASANDLNELKILQNSSSPAVLKKRILHMYFTRFRLWLEWLGNQNTFNPTFEASLTEILNSNKDIILKSGTEFYNLCLRYFKECQSQANNNSNALNVAGISIYEKDNKKYMALYGDRIMFYTTVAEVQNGTPCAFIENGAINAKLINVDTLNIQKLVGWDDKRKTISINELKKGEQILYWPNGEIMNYKLITFSNSGEIKGCAEYFFKQGVTLEDIKQGEIFIDSNCQKYIIKKIDYFSNGHNISFIPHRYLNPGETHLDYWIDIYDKSINPEYTSSSNFKSISELKAAIFKLGKAALEWGNTPGDVNNEKYKAVQQFARFVSWAQCGYGRNYGIGTSQYYTCNTDDSVHIYISKDGVNTQPIQLNSYVYEKDCTDDMVICVSQPSNTKDNYRKFKKNILSDGVYVIGYSKSISTKPQPVSSGFTDMNDNLKPGFYPNGNGNFGEIQNNIKNEINQEVQGGTTTRECIIMFVDGHKEIARLHAAVDNGITIMCYDELQVSPI